MGLLSWLFPSRCVACGQLGNYICSDCLNRLYPMDNLYCPVCRRPSLFGQTHSRCQTPYELDGLISCYQYRGLIKRLIAKYKYKFVSDLHHTLIELFVSETSHPQLFQQHHWTLIPIPLHSARLRWRGYNQAELLAQGLAHSWGYPLNTHTLIRHRHTTPQMTLSGESRKSNLVNAFSLKSHTSLPSHILLIDDVATSAATLRESAHVLKRAGAQSVWGLTLAQAIP